MKNKEDNQAMLTLGERILRAVEIAGIQQGELAAPCGVTEQAVSGWIKTSKIKWDHLPVIAKITGVDFQWLLTGEGAPINDSLEGSYSYGIGEMPTPLFPDGDLTTGMIRPLLPSAKMPELLMVTTLINDLRAERISEFDLTTLKLILQKFRGD